MHSTGDHNSNNGNCNDKKNCGCVRMTGSFSSNDYSVMLESDLTVTREEYTYSADINEDDDCIYCTTSHPNINLFLFLVAYIAFIILGACIFTFVENPVQVQMRDQLERKQQAFLVQHPSVDVESLNALLEYVTNMQVRGVHWEPLPVLHASGPLAMAQKQQHYQDTRESFPSFDKIRGDQAKMMHTSIVSGSSSTSIANITTSANAWEFTSSLLFVTSVVTTIGYGHITPLTHVGKITCMIFSAVGIPLTLTFLSTMVALLVRGPARVLETWLANFLLRLCRSASVFLIRLAHLILITSVLLCICFFLPAYAFYYFEAGWSYLDALYYCYISLTTIGLGDFVPAMGSEATQATYRLVTIIYLYFGLTMMMLWLALVYRIPQFNLNKLLISEERKSSISHSQHSSAKPRPSQERDSILNSSVSGSQCSLKSHTIHGKGYGTQSLSLNSNNSTMP